MSDVFFSGDSDVGLKRTKNEDAFVLEPELHFCAVADGMGGAAAGELASRFFIETASEVFRDGGKRSEEESVACVQRTFVRANERILSYVDSNPHHKGMGCTAELMAFFDGGFVLGHMGDSRTYRFGQGQLKQLSKDHSFVQDQIDRGLISRAEARNHRMRNIVLRAVGVKDSVALDITRGKTMEDDLFLLCSDGLTDMIEDSAIEEVLRSNISMPQKVEHLIGSAKSAGGRDNITVVLAHVR